MIPESKLKPNDTNIHPRLRYLAEKYSGKIQEKYINEFNNIRTDRHNLMYGLDEQETGEEEAKATIKLVKEFLEEVKKQLQTKD